MHANHLIQRLLALPAPPCLHTTSCTPLASFLPSTYVSSIGDLFHFCFPGPLYMGSKKKLLSPSLALPLHNSFFLREFAYAFTTLCASMKSRASIASNSMELRLCNVYNSQSLGVEAYEKTKNQNRVGTKCAVACSATYY